MIKLPVPTEDTPHPASYQIQLAPVPNVPPLTDRVVVLPLQIEGLETDIDVAGMEGDPTVTVTFAQAVLLQSPSALT